MCCLTVTFGSINLSVNVYHYETDFYGWANEQSALLRAGNFAALDITNLIEEIEGIAKSERRELKSRLIILLAHLLKWQYQPSKRVYGYSWEGTW